MANYSYGKCMRVLDLFVRLEEGKIIVKSEAARQFGVNERSIQRDIDDIRAFLDNRRVFEPQDERRIVYDRVRRGFVMETEEKNAKI
ncbi:MAG: hypothetical protein LUF00_09545 [Lachnospiraceae bacterium]|nr:hypothetical protein [Lachnospiraceae bacterium]